MDRYWLELWRAVQQGGAPDFKIHAPAGKHPLGRHEHMPARAPAHQHLGRVLAGPQQDQGGGVPWPLHPADAGSVEEVLPGVEGLILG